MSFTELKNAQARLLLLQLLTKAPEYRVNDGELADMLRVFGKSMSRDLLRSHLAWLAEQGLISLEAPTEVVQVAGLTIRGEDAAYGRAIIPGVKRPGPEDSI